MLFRHGPGFPSLFVRIWHHYRLYKYLFTTDRLIWQVSLSAALKWILFDKPCRIFFEHLLNLSRKGRFDVS
ncbi:MAG: hypothetical protein COX20_04145 [Desulfobacterales bacterium CG23_combo_of_CG06-09_8_20_14_all_52_9]|nr:MAG: hypothetical protein COX20_04145 [Desulfobacterales bacterium CG23_combo_of_CG06-09_8_20_14_all_52_9]